MLRNRPLFVLISTFLFFIIYLLIIGHYHNSDFLSTMRQFLGDTLALPVANDFFGYVKFFNAPVIIHLYIASFLIFIILAVVFRKEIHSRNFVFCILISLWAFITLWQNVKYIYTCKEHIPYFELKTTSAKYHYLFKRPYDFSQHANAKAERYHNCELITDMNVKKDPGMYYKCSLAYFLYPSFDTRGIRGKDTDCIVYYDKKNVLGNIPADHKIILKFNETDMITIKDK